MKVRPKKEWLAALRSGEYTQGIGSLHWGDGRMCCLGVLIDATQDGEWRYDERHGAYRFNDAGGMPTNTVLNAVGLDRLDASWLSVMNDSKRWSFAAIADWIEENL